MEAHERSPGTSVARLSVTVRITNVDEQGMVEANVQEPRVGQALQLSVQDEDGGTSVSEWKWERGEPTSPCGTVDSPLVSDWEPIPGARSNSYTPTAADAGHCIRVTAFYRDRAGSGKTEQFLTPNSVEFGPYFDSDTGTASVRENTAEGRNIQQFRARHSNSSETLMYSLTGADTTYFTIDDGQLKTSAVPLDYEGLTDHQAVVEITAADTQTPPGTATITVTVTVDDECQSAPASRPARPAFHRPRPPVCECRGQRHPQRATTSSTAQQTPEHRGPRSSISVQAAPTPSVGSPPAQPTRYRSGP